MEKKIDIDDKNEAIESKIGTFCSVLMKMPVFLKLVIVSEGKKLKLVESDTIRNLFSDLEEKNKFTDDQYVYNKTKDYYKSQSMFFPMLTGKRFIENPPSFDEYQSEFKEMTNRDFLKKFIKGTINLNKYFSAMPEWKRICLTFLQFVSTVSGIAWFLDGILIGSKLACFLGILIMCAWAGLICSLVFHLSLAVLIPSAIILGIMVIASLIATIRLYVSVDPVRQKCAEDIDQFFNLVDEINQYLDTHDLPPEKISLNEKEICGKQSIDEKIKNANTKKNNKKKSNIEMEKDDNSTNKEEEKDK